MEKSKMELWSAVHCLKVAIPMLNAESCGVRKTDMMEAFEVIERHLQTFEYLKEKKPVVNFHLSEQRETQNIELLITGEDGTGERLEYKRHYLESEFDQTGTLELRHFIRILKNFRRKGDKERDLCLSVRIGLFDFNATKTIESEAKKNG